MNAICKILAPKKCKFSYLMVAIHRLSYQYPFLPLAVKLSIKYLLPWPKIKLAICYSCYYLTSHYLSLQMSISVILACAIVQVALRRVGHKLLKPSIKILVQAVFVIIDKDASRNVHCVDKAEPLFDVAFCHYLCNQ